MYENYFDSIAESKQKDSKKRKNSGIVNVSDQSFGVDFGINSFNSELGGGGKINYGNSIINVEQIIEDKVNSKEDVLKNIGSEKDKRRISSQNEKSIMENGSEKEVSSNEKIISSQKQVNDVIKDKNKVINQKSILENKHNVFPNNKNFYSPPIIASVKIDMDQNKGQKSNITFQEKARYEKQILELKRENEELRQNYEEQLKREIEEITALRNRHKKEIEDMKKSTEEKMKQDEDDFNKKEEQLKEEIEKMKKDNEIQLKNEEDNMKKLNDKKLELKELT